MPEIPSSKTQLLQEGIKYISRLPFYEASSLTGRSFSKPLSISIVLTPKCNLNCPFCFMKKTDFKRKLNENELIKLIGEITEWGIKQITFTGGEVLTEKKLFFKLMKHAKSKGATVGFTTNGTLFNEEDIEEIKKIGVDRISVSIDGQKNVHEKLRGKGTYDKAMWLLNELKKMKNSSKNNQTPIIRINSLVFDGNIKSLESLFFLAKNFDAQLVLSPFDVDYVTAVKKRKIPAKIIRQMWIKKANLVSLKNEIEKLKKLKRKYGIILNSDSFLDSLVKYYSNPSAINHKCKIGTYHIGVTVEGDVVVCGFSGVLGNVKGNPLKDIWNSNKFAVFRKKMRNCNRCLMPCQYTPSAYELVNDFAVRPFLRKILNQH
jgi:MoaA/NifB/PqqE/SkfB family radical SAM enzyme